MKKTIYNINKYMYLLITLYCALGIYLFFQTMSLKPYTDQSLIYDTIWLDAWSLLFVIVSISVFLSKINWGNKSAILICLFSVFGLIVVKLFLNGTPFSVNAFWGDQQFRQAMILKFSEFGWFSDFYYKDLSPFYPPLFYWVLAKLSNLLSIGHIGMLKFGSTLIYFVGPPILYYFWKKIVTSSQALSITIATYLFCSFSTPLQFSVPHAFLADSFFIPWWLYFVEQLKTKKFRWYDYLIGGLVGGAYLLHIFMLSSLVGFY